MRHENTIQKKKTYDTPMMEVVDLKHHVSLLDGSNTIPNGGQPCEGCKFD
jgi:hypothetical protein